MNPDQVGMPARPQSTLCLSIAGLAVDLYLQDPRLEKAVRNRYKYFTGNQPANFSVALQVQPEGRQTPLMNASLHYAETYLEFFESGIGIVAAIDLQGRQAHLSTSGSYLLEDLEYCLRVIYAYLLFEAGGLLFHAAGIERDGDAYLFFGKSGIGKTTVSRVSTSCTILNDDLVAIMPDQATWIVHGTPFWNPSQVAPGRSFAPLHGLYRLVQDKIVYLETISPAVALGEIIANVPILSADPFRSIDLVARCISLIDTVLVRSLHFLPDDSFWPVVLERHLVPLESPFESSPDEI